MPSEPVRAPQARTRLRGDSRDATAADVAAACLRLTSSATESSAPGAFARDPRRTFEVLDTLKVRGVATVNTPGGFTDGLEAILPC